MPDTLNILLVDDDSSIRFSYRTLLEEAGHTIVGEAENGQIAVEKFTELKPQITLMDINMPVMDDLDALVANRTVDPTAKVVMVTSVDELAVWEDCMMQGAIGYIRKDEPFHEIAAKVSNLWKEHGG